jgi:hypothetical protein
MKRLAFGLVLALSILALIFNASPSYSQASPSSVLTLYSPTGCPSSGCAAGQRLNLLATYDLETFNSGLSPNVQVCIYTPNKWAASDFRIDSLGSVTNATYTPSIAHCNDVEPAPDNYTLLGGAYASLSNSSIFGDSLGFAFRIGSTANESGTVLMRVMEQAAGGWVRTAQYFLSINVVPSAETVFVANDAGSCSINSPCYINSGDDLANGLGTALKDAVDALSGNPQGKIVVLGNYTIKSQSVLVNQPVTISGTNDASLTYTGQICSQPMVRITAGATLRSLNINDGGCSSTSRDLVAVDSPEDVTIESNDLVNGANAVTIADNSGDVLLRFNQIHANSGYAALVASGSATGRLEALANNLYGNRSGAQVECNQKGRVDHNYWGGDSVTASRCTFTNGKRLGAAILTWSSAPGVQAGEFSVTSTKSSAFENDIAFQHTPGASDFNLYILNYGYSNIPFTGDTTAMSACSNYWDIFLADGSAPDSTLNLFFKYDLNSSCTATIESTSFCGQSDQTLLPLYWYDPVANLTDGWSTTAKSLGGNAGQDTACLTDSNELRVNIDSTGRPNLADDLHFLPFAVALPEQNASDIISSFTSKSSASQILLNWTTSNEYDVQTFYVQRYFAVSGTFLRISDAIAHKGSPQYGAAYQYLDTGLTDGVSYRYRLEIISTSQQTFYSDELVATAGVPTATPTVTLTPTQTGTPTYTRTPTRTRTPTKTRTPTRVSTSRYSYYSTSTPSRTASALTLTAIARTRQAGGSQPSATYSAGYPAQGTDTTQQGGSSSGAYPGPADIEMGDTLYPEPADGFLATVTPTERGFLTPTFTTTPLAGATGAEKPASSGPWLPVLIILSGLAAVAGVVWYLWKLDIIKLPFLPVALKGESPEQTKDAETNELPPDEEE